MDGVRQVPPAVKFTHHKLNPMEELQEQTLILQWNPHIQTSVFTCVPGVPQRHKDQIKVEPTGGLGAGHSVHGFGVL